MQACEHLKENLALSVYGELDPVAEREVASHLENCEGCRNEYRRLSSIMTKVKEASVSPQLSPLEARAMAANISRTLKGGSRRSWWRQYLEFMPSRLIPAAAIACALLNQAAEKLAAERCHIYNAAEDRWANPNHCHAYADAVSPLAVENRHFSGQSGKLRLGNGAQ